MGHYEQVFARPSKHGHNIKELIFMDGECIFLKSGRCSVYNNRPTACKIFPYTFDNGKETVDHDCPHCRNFEEDKNFISSGKEGLQRIIEDIQRSISLSMERESAK
jgi:Fe-S-cluster containining protein